MTNSSTVDLTAEYLSPAMREESLMQTDRWAADAAAYRAAVGERAELLRPDQNRQAIVQGECQL